MSRKSLLSPHQWLLDLEGDDGWLLFTFVEKYGSKRQRQLNPMKLSVSKLELVDSWGRHHSLSIFYEEPGLISLVHGDLQLEVTDPMDSPIKAVICLGCSCYRYHLVCL